MEELMQIVEEKRIPMLSMKEGVSWTKGNSTFHYVAPKKGNMMAMKFTCLIHENIGSLVFIYRRYGERGRGEFLAQIWAVDFGPVILKAGHHGSRTSSTEPFVTRFVPKLTIFSAGRNNMIRTSSSRGRRNV